MILYPRSVAFANQTDTTQTVTITASATIHTKGAWTQLLPAVAFDVFWVAIYHVSTSASGVDTSALLDIGADPAGGTTYAVRIPNLLIGHITGGSGETIGPWTVFPVYIPAGSTIAARSQSTVISATVEVGITVHGGIPTEDPYPSGTGLVVDYGIATASSSGTTPANANANVEGAWVELTAATTHPHRGLTVGLQGADGTQTAGKYLVDIAIGAASSEIALIEHILCRTQTTESMSISTHDRAYRRPIPEGVRLAVRAQADANNGQQSLDVAVYGWG